MSYSVGAKLRAGIKADVDGDAVANLKKAGAIPIAVTNTPELCASVETLNGITGYTCNPYDTTRSSGGSSGGEVRIHYLRNRFPKIFASTNRIRFDVFAVLLSTFSRVSAWKQNQPSSKKRISIFKQLFSEKMAGQGEIDAVQSSNIIVAPKR